MMREYEKLPGETPGFGPEDILISRTDDRGVILTANLKFRKTSGYDWDELRGAPHKIVRHTDMPKGVFWLLWDKLKQGESIGAFVKNKSKSGTFYWVFALVAPHEDEYISIRIRPSTVVTNSIASEYAHLLEVEQTEGLTPEQSAAALRERIKDLGYRSYVHFMCDMAAAQIMSRTKELGQSIDPVSEGMNELAKLWGQVRAECEKIHNSYIRISYTPLNLRIQAARMGELGISLSVIASNFRELAQQISSMIESFETQSHEVAQKLDQGRFLISAADLLHQGIDEMQEEAELEPLFDTDREVGAMLGQQAQCYQNSVEVLDTTRTAVGKFSDILRETSRVLSGLSVSRVMCEIENAYVGVSLGSGMAGTIAELGTFQDDAHESLQTAQSLLPRIERLIYDINRDVIQMSKDHQKTILKLTS